FRCETVESWRDQSVRNRLRKAPFRPVETRKPERATEIARDLLHATAPILGTLAEAYLLSRGCALPPRDTHLRFHPALKHYPTGTTHPAMLGAITNVRTGKLMGVHRTYLRPDGGGKADVQPARMI